MLTRAAGHLLLCRRHLNRGDSRTSTAEDLVERLLDSCCAVGLSTMETVLAAILETSDSTTLASWDAAGRVINAAMQHDAMLSLGHRKQLLSWQLSLVIPQLEACRALQQDSPSCCLFESLTQCACLAAAVEAPTAVDLLSSMLTLFTMLPDQLRSRQSFLASVVDGLRAVCAALSPSAPAAAAQSIVELCLEVLVTVQSEPASHGCSSIGTVARMLMRQQASLHMAQKAWPGQFRASNVMTRAGSCHGPLQEALDA